MDKDLIPLTLKEINHKLEKYPGWTYSNNKITNEFLFPSFSSGIKFLNKLAPFCDRIDHHPDIHIYYKKIVFDLQRFNVGGKVTLRDFRVASEIERLYSLV